MKPIIWQHSFFQVLEEAEEVRFSEEVIQTILTKTVEDTTTTNTTKTIQMVSDNNAINTNNRLVFISPFPIFFCLFSLYFSRSIFFYLFLSLSYLSLSLFPLFLSFYLCLCTLGLIWVHFLQRDIKVK